MPTILGLALAAAVYPQLLAVVVVILTRPSPKRLLWACYLAGFWTSLCCGVAIQLVFRNRGSVAGSTSQRLGASVFSLVGVIAVLIAIPMPTERSRRLLGRTVPWVPLRSGKRSERAGFVDEQKARAHRALERGSVPIAIAVGMLLGLPGPFDLLALGRTARGGYRVDRDDHRVQPDQVRADRDTDRELRGRPQWHRGSSRPVLRVAEDAPDEINRGGRRRDRTRPDCPRINQARLKVGDHPLAHARMSRRAPGGCHRRSLPRAPLRVRGSSMAVVCPSAPPSSGWSYGLVLHDDLRVAVDIRHCVAAAGSAGGDGPVILSSGASVLD